MKSRPFVPLAAGMRLTKRSLLLIVAVGFAAAAIYHLHLGSPAAQSAQLPELVVQVPADASSVLYMDLVALRATPWLAELAAHGRSAGTDPEYTRFARATGFDYTRDLDRVVIALRPGQSSSPAVALAEGRFDRFRITAYALLTGRLEHQSGAEVYVVPGSATSKEVAFAFLGPNRIALVEGSSLTPVLAQGSGAGLDPAMRERLARVAGGPIFAVARVGSAPEYVFHGLRSDQFANLARSVRWVSLAGRVDAGGLGLSAEGECDDSEQARQLAGTLDGLRLLGQAALADPGVRQRLDPERAADLDTLLRHIQVTQGDRLVRVILQLTPEMLKNLPARTPRGSPGS